MEKTTPTAGDRCSMQWSRTRDPARNHQLDGLENYKPKVVRNGTICFASSNLSYS